MEQNSIVNLFRFVTETLVIIVIPRDRTDEKDSKGFAM